MRIFQLLATVGAILLLGCRGSIQPAVNSVPLDTECGIRELSGNIRGVVLNRNREPAKGIRVRFVMSGDASIVTATDESGRFDIRCVYPSTGYQICLGPEATEQCQIVKGPNASATLRAPIGG